MPVRAALSLPVFLLSTALIGPLSAQTTNTLPFASGAFICSYTGGKVGPQVICSPTTTSNGHAEKVVDRILKAHRPDAELQSHRMLQYRQLLCYGAERPAIHCVRWRFHGSKSKKKPKPTGRRSASWRTKLGTICRAIRSTVGVGSQSKKLKPTSFRALCCTS